MEDLGAQLGSLDDDMLGLLHQFMRTCTGNAGIEWERLCAANGIHFDETGSAIGHEGQTVDVPTPDLVVALEREAVDFDKIKLGRSSMAVWRDKCIMNQVMEVQADAFYKRRLIDSVFKVWQQKLHKHQRMERKVRRFQQWQDMVVISLCLRRWVIQHREMSLHHLQNRQAVSKAIFQWRKTTAKLKQQEQHADDAWDFYAATDILHIWRQRAAESRALRNFKSFYLMAKYGRALAGIFRARKKAQVEAELTRRYRDFVRAQDEKLKRSALEQWHAKTVQLCEDEIIADKQHTHTQIQGTRMAAHNMLTNMYDQTVNNLVNQEIAEVHYQHSLFNRLGVLSASGKWRTQTAEDREKESRADSYRGIKTEEKAQSVLRSMRNAAARNRQLAAMADEWKEKQDKRKPLALGYLAVWRQKAAEKRGVAPRYEPSLPQTPAAKKSALLR
ncbi:hypothetical protein DV738_g1613, partial [Chaetothyriales sp. CBS 135597]